MGFQAFYPTIPLVRTFRHFSLIVLGFLKGNKCVSDNDGRCADDDGRRAEDDGRRA